MVMLLLDFILCSHEVYCSSFIYYFTNFLFAPFFSLSSLGSTNSVTLLSSSSSFSSDAHKHKHTHTQTHPYRQINTEIYLLKKKKHKDTQTPTHKQTQMDKQQKDRLVLIRMIRARGSCLIGARGTRLIKARGYGSCLIGARESSVSVLVDRSLGDRCLPD